MNAIKKPEEYTKYEKARILGARALQISANAPILVKLQKDELQKINYDPIKIAEIEFEQGILPITVKRPLPKKIEKKETHLIEIVKEEDIEEEAVEVEKTERLSEEKENERIVENIESKTEDEKENAELDESDIANEFEKAESEEEI